MAQRKPYNPNTAYGRRKMREQAARNIANYTPEEKASFDNTKAGCMIALIIFLIIAGFIVYKVSGPEGLKKFLK